MSGGPGYRDAPASKRPARKGLFDSVFGYRPPQEGVPKIRTAFVRGVLAVGATPWLLIIPLLAVAGIWVAVVASGYPGPFGVFGGFLSVPPVSTNMDVGLPTVLLPSKLALLGGLVSVLPRGLFLAITSAMIVDVLDGKPVTRSSLRRGVRALPTAIGVCIIGIGFWIFTLLAAQTLGPGLGTLVQVGVPALGVYLFGFAVSISVSERRGMADSLAKSVRAARIPGSSNLLFALLYVFISAVIQVALTSSYGRFDVNPSLQAWAWVLLANLFNVCVYATLTFRYLALADSVPDAPARRSRGGQAPSKPVAKGAAAKKPQVKGKPVKGKPVKGKPRPKR